MIDCQRDLFISGDVDRVVLLFTRGISDYQRDLFFCGDLSVASVSLIGIRYTGPYHNYNNNNSSFINLSFNKLENGDILVLAYLGCLEKWQLNEYCFQF